MIAALLVLSVGLMAQVPLSFAPEICQSLPGPLGLQGYYDQDADGDLDAILIDPNLHQIRIGRNDGAGVWSLQAGFNVAPNPVVACAGDLDGDGDMDLAVLTSNLVISVLRFTAGTFVRADFPGPNSVTVSGLMELIDWEGDGDKDLFVGRQFVMLNNGAGSFASAMTVAFSTGYTGLPVAAADLDGDGDTDFARLVTSTTLPTAVEIIIERNVGGS
ncbi:MAG: VCBS repeat-containing protein, partial [Planctomycetes bacterium]|nr:VCBS repeat-containing protein [Planctomycetota bacterium]